LRNGRGQTRDRLPNAPDRDLEVCELLYRLQVIERGYAREAGPNLHQATGWPFAGDLRELLFARERLLILRGFVQRLSVGDDIVFRVDGKCCHVLQPGRRVAFCHHPRLGVFAPNPVRESPIARSKL
jgi:hypothetical protein